MRAAAACFSLMVLIGSAASAADLQGTFDRTFDVRPGTSFVLDNTNGRVVVRSWDVPRVHVHAVKHAESRDPSEAKKVFDAMLIVPSQTADSLRIETRIPRRNDGLFDWIAGISVNMTVLYDVTVPRSMNVQVDNTNGTIEISDVRGSIRVSNTNGRIDCSHCAGSLDAETTNGPIRAEFTDVDRGGAVRLQSTNGGLHVSLPRTVGARVDASTTNGSVRTDLPVLSTSSQSHELRGTINGGGAELRLRTTNGSISIQAH